MVGEGFTFDSNDDGVTIPHNVNLNVNSTGFTAEFWMKGIKNQPQTLYNVVDKSHGFGDNTGWTFQGESATGGLSFLIGAGGGSPFINFPGVGSAVDVLDNVAGTWDGSTIQLYVDGVLQGTAPLSTAFNNTRALNIGFWWSGGTPQRFFRGIVDELEIFSRALSASEIQAIYNAGSAGKCRGVDTDGDGVPDDQDICPGFDDTIDTDSDAVPDDCDACPQDAANDADGDGFCGEIDTCALGDDRLDADGDGTADACDLCPQDAANDADGDGFCGNVDNCPTDLPSQQSVRHGHNALSGMEYLG